MCQATCLSHPYLRWANFVHNLISRIHHMEMYCSETNFFDANPIKLCPVCVSVCAYGLRCGISASGASFGDSEQPFQKSPAERFQFSLCQGCSSGSPVATTDFHHRQINLLPISGDSISKLSPLKRNTKMCHTGKLRLRLQPTRGRMSDKLKYSRHRIFFTGMGVYLMIFIHVTSSDDQIVNTKK